MLPLQSASLRRNLKSKIAGLKLVSGMASQDTLPTELILTHPQRSLGQAYLDWSPHPGAYVNFEGNTYAVLERRHRYQLKANRYHLAKIDLYVQAAAPPKETSLIGDRRVLGDATCRYNAHSELIRCAVNAAGPCQNCLHYEPRGFSRNGSQS